MEIDSLEGWQVGNWSLGGKDQGGVSWFEKNTNVPVLPSSKALAKYSKAALVASCSALGLRGRSANLHTTAKWLVLRHLVHCFPHALQAFSVMPTD